MLNPVKWKSEHVAALIVGCVAGAALGLAVGFANSTARGWGLSYWLHSHMDDAGMFAAVGALVAGALVFCYRAFSN